MIRMPLLAAGALLAVAVASIPAAAQQKPAPQPLVVSDTARKPARAATEAAADSAVLELGRAVAVLAASVEKVVVETANNPEVRLAVIQTAGHAVAMAQTTLAENLGEIEKMLAEANRKLAELAAKQKAKAASP